MIYLSSFCTPQYCEMVLSLRSSFSECSASLGEKQKGSNSIKHNKRYFCKNFLQNPKTFHLLSVLHKMHPRLSVLSQMFKVQESSHLYRCVVQMCLTGFPLLLTLGVWTDSRSMELSPNTEKDLKCCVWDPSLNEPHALVYSHILVK